MRLILIYILVVLTKKVIVCQCEDLNYQNLKKHIVLCREKFTEKTNRDYTNYTGCLIQKNNTILSLR